MIRNRLVFGIVLAAIAALPLSARAGTVGSVDGTIRDAVSRVPVADVRVTAAAPSGTYKAITDSHGFFAMTGMIPDTYTVTLQKDGYEPISVTGVTVFADAAVEVSPAMHKTLKTIAAITSRASGGAFQPDQTSDTYTVNARVLQDIQGTNLNINEAAAITSLPGATYTNSLNGARNNCGNSGACSSVSIRGGRINAVGFETEGIPYTEPNNNFGVNGNFLPMAAISSLQLTPGVSDAQFGDAGTGTVNLTAKRGTYPGTFDAEAGIGGPDFHHAISLDWGTATQNGRFSNFASFTGENDDFLWGNGAYPAGQINQIGGFSTEVKREFTDNFVFHWGTGNRNELQLFYDTLWDNQQWAFGETYAQNFPSGNISNLQGWESSLGWPNISPAPGQSIFQADPILKLMQEFYPLAAGQTFPNETYAEAGNRSPAQYITPTSTFKVQYARHINSSTYFSVAGWRSESFSSDDYIDPVINFGGYQSGLTLLFEKYLSAKNNIEAGADYKYVIPTVSWNWPTGAFYGTFYDNPEEVYDFVPPSYCNSNIYPNSPNNNLGPGTTPATNYCGYLYKYFPGASLIPLPGYVENNYVRPKTFSAYLADTWRPNDRLNVDAGLRLDDFNYGYPSPGVDPATCTFLFPPSYWQMPDAQGNLNGKPIGPGNCPQARFDFTHYEMNPEVLQPRLSASWLLGSNDVLRASYGRSTQSSRTNTEGETLDPSAYSRFSSIPSFANPGVWCHQYGSTYINQVSGAYGEPNMVPCTSSNPPAGIGPPSDTCGMPGYSVPCLNYGEQLYWDSVLIGTYVGRMGAVYNPVPPTTYNNYDVSYEHQFTHGLLKGVGVRLTPWARRGYNLETEVSQIQTNAAGQPVRQPNGSFLFQPAFFTGDGIDISDGIELYVTRLKDYGISAIFSASYQNVRTNVPPPNGIVDGNDFSEASAALGTMYHAGFLPPLETSLTISEHTRSGWRLAINGNWNNGFPTGVGNYSFLFIDGKPYTLRNTNASNGVVAGNGYPQGTPSFVDPVNPGSYFKPNIAATRGTPEGAYAGGLISPPDSQWTVTLEKEDARGNKLGLQVFNLFNEVYEGPQWLGNGCCAGGIGYQPVATGISGPLTGQNPAFYNPSSVPGVNYNIPVAFHGNQAYFDVPGGEGRTYYLYYSIKV
ncbi:MAG TPA: carboxypeptidase regulatory-like domain-containing protein [Candidatus Baltobacteraceae bacterium]|jgi:hypothetical protein|nr:carboxypeptidase regulatory-like domain-containing protein [Candidatus Baltobacteraceae bacterium]